jgi:hypothetical protein
LSDERDELDLLAFRYVAGEMTPDEAAALEARLADDQTARDAVSRAVGLAQLVASAAPPVVEPASPAGKSSLAWAAPLAWMAIGAAAAVVAIGLLSPPRGPAVNPPIVQPAGGPVDALVWARLQSDQEVTVAGLEDWLDGSAQSDEADEPPINAEVPSWVFAARPAPRGANP